MSKLFYKALGSASLKDIISDINAASTQLDVDFFGVGAFARNVWYVSNNEASRGTKDVDFAVYVPNAAIYSQLKNILIQEFSYTKVSTNAFCLISPSGIPLDLLPFGEIEKQGKVMIEGTGLVSINLDGFSETYANGLVVAEIENDHVKVCSIPSVILLKLIAFDDRPENRPNDPLDIDSIIQFYPEIETEMIWGEYNFLYIDNDELSHEEIGIKVLGHELSKIIFDNEHLTERVLNILTKAIGLKSELPKRMIQNSEEETVASKIKKLDMLKTGIEEGLANAKSQVGNGKPSV